jgi:hypothetical protein
MDSFFLPWAWRCRSSSDRLAGLADRLAPLGTRQSALVNVSWHFRRGGSGFCPHHARAEEGNISTYTRPREACSFGSENKRRNRDFVSPGYRARTALVAIPWFLMHIATYGVGLLLRLFWEQLESPGQRVALSRTILLSQREAVSSIRVSDWKMDGSTIWAHSDANHRFRRNDDWNVAVNCCCRDVEPEFASWTGVCRLHRVQPADERRSELDHVHAPADCVSHSVAWDSRWIRCKCCQGRRDVWRFSPANRERKIRSAKRPWNRCGSQRSRSHRYVAVRSGG